MEVVNSLMSRYEANLPTPDPRTHKWFMLENNPLKVWIASLTYLFIVIVGPRVMKNRKPYNLHNFMLVYNLSLVILSAYMFIEIILSIWDANYNWICAPYNEETIRDPKELRVANVLWLYFFSKVIEFMDTILMVLRKKTSQITFLHVFHHFTMLHIWWWVMMYIPGGLAYFGACINCGIHILMYSYYGLAAFPSMKGKLWWKKYITRLQMMQFAACLVHTVNSLLTDCDFPKWGQYMLAGYMVVLLMLFLNFYLHAYIMRKSGKRRDKKQGASKPHLQAEDRKQALNGHSNNYVQTSDGFKAEKRKKKQ